MMGRHKNECKTDYGRRRRQRQREKKQLLKSNDTVCDGRIVEETAKIAVVIITMIMEEQ